MAKGDELVRYITEQVIGYIGTPKEERKYKRNKVKEPWHMKWFGMMPMGVSMWVKDIKKPIKRKKTDMDSKL
ncbi:YqzE family protein [Paenibacillus provencensis]|uniref:YqzE family protein n=1 Tax=Paenibacillus provencensis TaxID=441151 RepID=A0ABW3PXL5_9BACL|nr:YqzE family protein [Paenibacillus sp. MER 78]MCM3130261.1 YqzE family protein [Paenibacillus sp. MER 78]